MISVIKGEESSIHERYMQKLLSTDVSPSETDELTKEDIEWLVETDLFGSEKALVVTIDELKADEAFVELLSEYKDAGHFIIKIMKCRENLKVWKWLKQNATVMSAEHLNDNDYDKFLKSECKANGMAVDNGIISYMKEKFSYDTDDVNLYQISVWIKMLSFCDEVSRDMIDSLVNVTSTQTAFDIIGYLSSGNSKAAIEAAVSKKKDAIAVLSALQWAVRLSIKLKMFSPEEVGVSAWQSKNLRAFISKDMNVLDQMYKELSEGIAKIKTGIPNRDILVRTVAFLYESLCRA